MMTNFMFAHALRFKTDRNVKRGIGFDIEFFQSIE